MNKQNFPQSNEPIQSSKNIWITIIAVIVTALVVGGGVYAWQRSNLKNTEQGLQQQIDSLENQIKLLQQSKSQDNNATSPLTEIDSDGEANISGTLSFPGEVLPSMTVCAVNITNSEETCIPTKSGQNSYSIMVEPGEYLIYALATDDMTPDGMKAYYTKCDTYEDRFIPECNPNAGPPEDNGKWNHYSFICFKDPICKAAFTPLSITVEAGEKKQLNTLTQGWYIPCSHDTQLCNNPDFDIWSDYLE